MKTGDIVWAGNNNKAFGRQCFIFTDKQGNHHCTPDYPAVRGEVKRDYGVTIWKHIKPIKE